MKEHLEAIRHAAQAQVELVDRMLVALEKPRATRVVVPRPARGEATPGAGAVLVNRWTCDAQGTGWLSMKAEEDSPDPPDDWRGQWFLTRECPDESWAGLMCHDRTGDALARLAPGRREPVALYDAQIADLRRQLDWFRKRRPHARHGFYDYPAAPRDDASVAAWADAWRGALSLFEHCDVLFPTFGRRVRDGVEAEDVSYTRPIRLALELAERAAEAAGRADPLEVWISARHRFANVDEEVGFRLVPGEEQIEHVRALLTVEHNGVTAAGVVAWAGDETHYRRAHERHPEQPDQWLRPDAAHARIRRAFAEEMRPGESLADYLNDRLYPTVHRDLRAAAGVRGRG